MESRPSIQGERASAGLREWVDGALDAVLSAGGRGKDAETVGAGGVGCAVAGRAWDRSCWNRTRMSRCKACASVLSR